MDDTTITAIVEVARAQSPELQGRWIAKQAIAAARAADGIPKGSAVYQTGSSGTTLTVALADASAEATAAQTRAADAGISDQALEADFRLLYLDLFGLPPSGQAVELAIAWARHLLSGVRHV
jgi:hypothetical protein